MAKVLKMSKQRILGSDLHQSSWVGRRVLLVSHFSPNMRHRIGESTDVVIWKLVSMGRTAGFVGKV